VSHCEKQATSGYKNFALSEPFRLNLTTLGDALPHDIIPFYTADGMVLCIDLRIRVVRVRLLTVCCKPYFPNG
jgi:hypothetical protein